MDSKIDEGITLKDLEIQKMGLEERIKRLEAELMSPLDPVLSDQVGGISNLLILKRILEVERSYLCKLNFEIEKKLQSQDR